MIIYKIIGVFIEDQKYLVVRDHEGSVFKNVGGKLEPDESDIDCLRRELLEELGYEMSTVPSMIFDFPPTPAVGRPDDTVVLRGYLVSRDTNPVLHPESEIAELVWVNTQNQEQYLLTPQISELILPRLKELGYIC